MLRVIIHLIVIVFLLCLTITAHAGDIQSKIPKKEMEYPKLESRLYKLMKSKDPASYAIQNRLYYSKGSVRVIMELASEDTPLPKNYLIQVEGRYGNLVQVVVPLKLLGKLSQSPGIKYIRPSYLSLPLGK